jgi:hypothetical protein
MAAASFIQSLGGTDGLIRLTVTLVSGGFAGAILTLIAKTISDKRQRKALNVKTIIESISQDLSKGSSSPKGIKLSYSGAEFDNLSHCRIILSNPKKHAIGKFSLYLTFPEDTTFIKKELSCTPTGICVLESNQSSLAKSLVLYEIDRLEYKDSITFSILVDCSDISKLRSNFRGLPDDVDIYGDTVKSEANIEDTIRLLLLFASLFIFANIIPFHVGSLLQAFLVLLSAKPILRLFAEIASHFKEPSLTTSTFSPLGDQVSEESSFHKHIEVSKSAVLSLSDIIVPAYKQECPRGISVFYYTPNQRLSVLSSFLEEHNFAKSGIATASTHYQDRDPMNILKGLRTGDSWTLNTNPGWLNIEWAPNVNGRYILLINRTSTPTADPWGKSTVFINNNFICNLIFDFSGSSIIVIDLSKNINISRVHFEINGNTYPGLSGLEIHQD